MKSRLRVFAGAAVVTLCCLGSTPALAGDPGAAEALFSEAKELMDAGKTDEACEKFAASMTADPSGGTLINLARCHETQGKTATAWSEYKAAAPLFASKGDRKREVAARELADGLEPKLSRLKITISNAPSDAVITRGGESLSVASLGASLPIDPGTHEIKVQAPGFEDFSTTVTIGAQGDNQQLPITLTPGTPSELPPPVPPSSGDDGVQPTSSGPETSTILGIGLIGVGAVAMGIGGVLGITVLGDASDADSDVGLCGNDKQCTPEGRDVIDGAEGKALASNILIGVGAAAAVVGVVVLVVGGSDEPVSAQVGGVSPQGISFRPMVDGTVSGIAAHGRF